LGGIHGNSVGSADHDTSSVPSLGPLLDLNPSRGEVPHGFGNNSREVCQF